MQEPSDKKQKQTERGEAASRSSRRKLLKAGVFLVPAIVTLRARAAFGDTFAVLDRNYQTVYMYGDNEGSTTFQVHNVDPTPVGTDLFRSNDPDDPNFYTFKN